MQTTSKIIDFKRTKKALSSIQCKEQFVRKFFNNKLKSKNIFYNKEPYPLCLNPLFLKEGVTDTFNKISKNFINMVIDTLNILKNDKGKLKEIIDSNSIYKKLEKSIFSLDTKAIKNIFYRIDGIIDRNQIKLIEANMNSPGGIFTLQEMHKIGADLFGKILKERTKFFQGLDYVLEHFIKIYKSKFKEGELFLTIGKKDDSERSEHKLFTKKLREEGIPAKTLDYREKISFKRNYFYYKNKKVGVIYRRIFPLDYNQDIIEKGPYCSSIILNPLASYFLGNKALFALFYKFKDNKLKKYKNFIEKNIAPTFFLKDINKEELIKKKDSYVLKEPNLYCGKGVHIGKAISKGDWIKIISNANPSGVAQKYYKQPSIEFIDNKKQGTFLRKFDFNIYCIGKKVIMPYVRINKQGEFKSNNACGSSDCLCYKGEKNK